MTRLIRVLIIMIFLAITGFLVTYRFRPEILRNVYRYARNLVTHCNDYNQKNFSAELNDKLPDYFSLSEKSGIQPCSDEAELLLRAQNGVLTEVNGGDGYVVDDLHFSYPYLTREAVKLLEDIAIGFKTEISGTRLKDASLILTSMTRTTETNNALSKRNSNASGRSPHLYGNAFDLTYVRYKTRRLYLSACDKKYLQSTLSEVILELKKDNRCWATFERAQHCFHIVAR